MRIRVAISGLVLGLAALVTSALAQESTPLQQADMDFIEQAASAPTG
jgi:hypothetical protein